MIDAIVNRIGTTTCDVGTVVYERIDQGIVDKAVNATGVSAEGAGSILRLLQSGKVQQYGACSCSAQPPSGR